MSEYRRKTGILDSDYFGIIGWVMLAQVVPDWFALLIAILSLGLAAWLRLRYEKRTL